MGIPVGNLYRAWLGWMEQLGMVLVVLWVPMVGLQIIKADYSDLMVKVQTPYVEPLEYIEILEETRSLPEVPELGAEAFLVSDLGGNILLEENALTRKAPASTTKIMTALVALETFELDGTMVQPQGFRAEGSQVGLLSGEVIGVENALYALMLPSGNDIAELFALSHPAGREGFIVAMNEKAKELGMATANFRNPSGLDEEGHLMSARDLLTLGQAALDNPVLSRIVSTSQADIYEVRGHYVLENKNVLLDEELGVTGIKTGYTGDAGEVLVTSIVRGEQTFIIVVMGSEDRFEDTRKLIGWVDEVLGGN